MHPVFVLAALLAVAPAASRAAESPPRPNIVYILADDLGYGDVRALNPGRSRIPTPNLDRLASQGMVFTDAHSGSSVCTPTRYGLLTGRYAWRTRLQTGVLDGTDDPPLIAAHQLTVPALLRQHGYTTAAMGKWHLGFTSTLPPGITRAQTGDSKAGRGGLPPGSRVHDGPTTRGFDYFWGCSNARTMSGLVENDRVIESIEPVDMLPRLGRRAVAWVGERAADARAGRPFFLYLALTSPHTPIVPAPEWKGRSGLGNYADFVMQTDAVVGDVLDALERQGLAGNTLVIFTSDNGCAPAAGINALEREGHFPSAHLRGYKADIWEGGHRVPFIAQWPGRIKSGTRSSRLICHTDLLATCAELLGTRLPDAAGGDSISLLPALLGDNESSGRESVIHHSIDGMFAIRDGRWKLALCAGSGGWGRPGDVDARRQSLPAVQLYDLETDPAESTNLLSAHPDVITRLRQRLAEQVSLGRSTPGPRLTNDVPVDLAKAGKVRNPRN